MNSSIWKANNSKWDQLLPLSFVLPAMFDVGATPLATQNRAGAELRLELRSWVTVTVSSMPRETIPAVISRLESLVALDRIALPSVRNTGSKRFSLPPSQPNA